MEPQISCSLLLERFTAMESWVAAGAAILLAGCSHHAPPAAAPAPPRPPPPAENLVAHASARLWTLDELISVSGLNRRPE